MKLRLRDQPEVTWQFEKSLSPLSQDLWPLLGTVPKQRRYVKHVNLQWLLVSSRLNLRPTNHKERYFISRDQFHSTSNIFWQQWNNIIHRLSNASSHHLLRFFSIQKRYHRLDLIRGSRKITIESDQPGARRSFFCKNS